MIEPPFDPDRICANVLRNPAAARELVGLLRVLPDLSYSAGLEAESLAYGRLQGGAEHRAWLSGRGPACEVPPRQVSLDRRDECLQVTMADPASGNAIDRTMRDALREAFELAALDPSLVRIELRGAGKAFSLGAELAEFGTTRDPEMAHAIRQQTLPAWPLAQIADRLHVFINGACIGAGLEMAAWGKRIEATSRSWFQLPELAMGLIPGAGGCVSLTRRIGRQRTALLVLSGQRINARQALALGLVDALVE